MRGSEGPRQGQVREPKRSRTRSGEAAQKVQDKFRGGGSEGPAQVQVGTQKVQDKSRWGLRGSRTSQGGDSGSLGLSWVMVKHGRHAECIESVTN